MSLVAFDGTPLVAVGHYSREGNAASYTLSNITMLASNQAAIYIGQIFTEDGGSHTLDTSGSSSLGWRCSSATFLNSGTTVKVGLAAIDTSNGPPGRATNVSDVISFSVSKSIIGGSGGITSNSWQEHVPDTGSLSVANGDLVAFAVQMTARGGSDSVLASFCATAQNPIMPQVTFFSGSTYSAQVGVPNAVITFHDGTLGFFYGGMVASQSPTTQTWANNSAKVEYGNLFQAPFPMSIYGMLVSCNFAGDCSAVVYSDPLGTPVAQATTAVDLNTVGSSGVGRWCPLLFSAPYSVAANAPVGAVLKPTTTTSVSSVYSTMNASAHQKSLAFGVNGYAINRASGAFAAQNSNKDRFAIGLLVGAFDAGGGGTIYPRSGLQGIDEGMSR